MAQNVSMKLNFTVLQNHKINIYEVDGNLLYIYVAMTSSTKLNFRKIKIRQLFIQKIQKQIVKFNYHKFCVIATISKQGGKHDFPVEAHDIASYVECK